MGGNFSLSNFFIFETAGSILKYREIEDTVFRRIVDTFFFKEWLTFHEASQYHLLTLIFGIAFLFPGLYMGIKILLKKA